MDNDMALSCLFPLGLYNAFSNLMITYSVR